MKHQIITEDISNESFIMILSAAHMTIGTFHHADIHCVLQLWQSKAKLETRHSSSAEVK